jgi:putative ABC transport system permease protein
LIRIIGVIVPRRLRADWRQEWEAELRSREMLLAEWDKLDRRNKLDLLRRSVGAFWDALCLQPRRLEDEMFQDLRYGARMLLRQPAFTLAAITALALGIGANTAVFSVVNAVLLRPLPYQNSERMVVIWGNFLKLNIEQLSAKAAEYVDYRDRTQSFDTVAAFSIENFFLTGGSEPDRVAGARVTANLFPMLGAHAAQGRLISPEENQPGRDNVVVVSDGFRRRRLGGEANVIGRSVVLNDSSYAIIGVMPAGFEFPHPSFNFTEPADFWIPLAFTTEQVAERRRPWYLNVVALLKPNVTVEEARAEMAALGEGLKQEYPREYLGPNRAEGGWRISVTPLQEQIVGDSRRSLLLLFAAVALVLLIACANAANLLLMRASIRRREMAVRAAMGARRLRLIRQLLTESVLISTLSASVGLMLAWLGIKALAALGPDNLPRLGEIDLDGRVLSFTVALSILTGLIFGVAPAVQAARPDLQQALKEGVAATGGRRRLRRLLVVGEVAIAMTLLACAGLMLNSFVRLQRVDTVVSADKLLSVEINLPQHRYPETSQTARFFRELIGRVESLPGVESASLCTIQPLSGFARNDPFSIEGRSFDSGAPTWASWQAVTPNHFRTLGVPFVAGRDFTELDTAEAPGVAIISEAMARRYFLDEDPLGKRITLGLPRADNPWLTIVGIVKDIPQRGLESNPEPDWYLSYFRRPSHYGFVILRTSGDPAGLASAVRSQVSAIDGDQPAPAIRTIKEVIASTTAPRRFNTLLLAVFAAVALALAAVGVYSVISYSVTQQTRELGIRMALGARSGNVIRLILKQGLTITLIGIAGGFFGGIAAARVISGMLFDVTPTDPATFLGMSFLLAAVAFLACYLPARRATKIDPIAALRHE